MTPALIERLKELAPRLCDQGCVERCKYCPEDVLMEAAAELSRLRKSEAELRLDASRYRWLRERVNYTTGETLSPCKVIYRRWFHDTTWTPAGTNNPGMFDAAIDAARAALGETKK